MNGFIFIFIFVIAITSASLFKASSKKQTTKVEPTTTESTNPGPKKSLSLKKTLSKYFGGEKKGEEVKPAEVKLETSKSMKETETPKPATTHSDNHNMHQEDALRKRPDIENAELVPTADKKDNNILTKSIRNIEVDKVLTNKPYQGAIGSPRHVEHLQQMSAQNTPTETNNPHLLQSNTNSETAVSEVASKAEKIDAASGIGHIIGHDRKKEKFYLGTAETALPDERVNPQHQTSADGYGNLATLKAKNNVPEKSIRTKTSSVSDQAQSVASPANMKAESVNVPNTPYYSTYYHPAYYGALYGNMDFTPENVLSRLHKLNEDIKMQEILLGFGKPSLDEKIKKMQSYGNCNMIADEYRKTLCQNVAAEATSAIAERYYQETYIHNLKREWEDLWRIRQHLNLYPSRNDNTLQPNL